MTAEAAFSRLLAAARGLYDATPALQGFQDWPNDLRWANRAHVPQPATAEIAAQCPKCCPASQALADALPDVFDRAEWRVTYTADEVGQDFIDRYGYFELYGPSGMYHSDQARAYVGFWGAGLVYPEHRHQAEEIYYICGGSALFDTEGQPQRRVGPGDWHEHAANQRHAMRTEDQALLTFVLWRGAGMAGLPEIAT